MSASAGPRRGTWPLQGEDCRHGPPARPVWLGLLAVMAGVVLAHGARAATYFVRPDGGLATECDGLSNAAYRGPGSGRHCAWKGPMVALPPGGPARIQGGDTLRIAPGAYRVGLNAPGADGCRSDWPWDCMMAPLPSGPDAARPTRLLGQAEDGSCREPPQLWGTERVTAVLNLTGTRHAEAACLEITDHSSCAEFHSGALKCERDSFPYGDWARAGVLASDSADVRLAQLDIHGLANAGVQAGRLRDWRLQEVRIAGNGWVGWNGDLGGDKGSSNSGLMHFSQVEIEWNGCPEAFSTAVGAPASLPARVALGTVPAFLASRPAVRPAGCWGQSAGGYGDGLGTAKTAGTWLIEDSRIRYNTQDGLDLLYHSGEGSVTLRRVWAEGNAGNQLKVAGPGGIENSVVVADCGFFRGKPFTLGVDDCRAQGDAVALFARSAGETLLFTNNTVVSEGNTALLYTGAAGARLVAQNNILIGRPSVPSPGRASADLYADPSTPDGAVTDRYNLKAGLRNTVCRGPGTLCLPSARGVLMGDAPGRLDPRPGSASPARASGLPAGQGGVPLEDFRGQARRGGQPASRGAVEPAAP